METFKNVVIVKDKKEDKESLLTYEKERPIEVLVLSNGLERCTDVKLSSSEIHNGRYSTTAVLLISFVITVTCLIGGLALMAIMTQPRTDNIPDNNIASSPENNGFLGITFLEISFGTVEEEPDKIEDNNMINMENTDTSAYRADEKTADSSKDDNVLKSSDVFNEAILKNDYDNDDDFPNSDDDKDKGKGMPLPWGYATYSSEEDMSDEILFGNKDVEKSIVNPKQHGSSWSDSWESESDESDSQNAFNYKK